MVEWSVGQRADQLAGKLVDQMAGSLAMPWVALMVASMAEPSVAQ